MSVIWMTDGRAGTGAGKNIYMYREKNCDRKREAKWFDRFSPDVLM